MFAHCTRLIRIVAWLSVVTPIGTVSGQTDTTTAAAPATSAQPACWRPRPAPACSVYLVTEFAYEHPVASTAFATGLSQAEEDDFGPRFVLAAGLMRNRGTSSALGGLMAVSTDDPEGLGLLRVEGRYRRWLGSRAGVDVGLGLAQKWVYSENGMDENVRARGLTAGVGLDFGYAGVDARIDRLRGGGRSRNGAFVGVHAGSQLGTAAAGVAAVATLIALIAWLSSG